MKVHMGRRSNDGVACGKTQKNESLGQRRRCGIAGGVVALGNGRTGKLTHRESKNHVSVTYEDGSLDQTYDTSQGDGPARNIVTPEVKHSRQSGNFEWDKQGLV